MRDGGRRRLSQVQIRTQRKYYLFLLRGVQTDLRAATRKILGHGVKGASSYYSVIRIQQASFGPAINYE